jgi:hypothetical protein
MTPRNRLQQGKTGQINQTLLKNTLQNRKIIEKAQKTSFYHVNNLFF